MVVTHDVANPDYVELQALLAEAHRATTTHKHHLDRAAYLMGSAQVWTGPSTATGFAAEVEGRKGSLPGDFEDFAAEIEHQMTRTPATVVQHIRVW